MSALLICPPIHPNIYPDESPLGYLLRLKTLNQYPATSWLLERGAKPVQLTSSRRAFEAIYASSWCQPNTISELTRESCQLPLNMQGQLGPYCPICLGEENYWREQWRVPTSHICLAHQRWLLGSSTDQQQSVVVTESCLALQNFLENGHTPTASLFIKNVAFPLKQRVLLVHRLLNLTHDLGGKIKAPSAGLFMPQEFSRIAEALMGGIQKFQGYLSELFVPLAEHKTRRKLFNHLDRSFNHKATKEFQVVLFHHFNTMSLPTRKSLPIQHLDESPWLSIEGACRIYQIPPSRLKQSIGHQEIKTQQKPWGKKTVLVVFEPDVQSLKERQEDEITATDAAAILGLTHAQFKSIQGSGVFQCECPPQPGGLKRWRYSKREIRAFANQQNKL